MDRNNNSNKPKREQPKKLAIWKHRPRPRFKLKFKEWMRSLRHRLRSNDNSSNPNLLLLSRSGSPNLLVTRQLSLKQWRRTIVTANG